MPPIKTIVNQFRGINPHLHSRLQADGGWEHFHVNHISDLTRFLQRDLRKMGYVVQSEQSLQIKRGAGVDRAPESDVTMYDPERRLPTTSGQAGGFAVPLPTLLQLDEAELATYRAVGIYQKTEGNRRGDPVAWLELLSPTNKPGGRHFAAYRDKRTALLQAGLVFVELDYLHHQPPTVAAPPYPDAPNSSCFRVVVIDPRPDWLQAEGRVYPIGVDQPLPTLPIPLNGGDVLHFDFDAPYQQTYTGLFFGDDVDYSERPVEWARFRGDDQARILSRLLALRHGEVSGAYPPPEVSLLSLAAANRRWTSPTSGGE